MNTFNYFWPAALIVFSNIIYQICTKGIPQQMNTYASMAVTYGVATVFSVAAYFVTSKGGNIFKEFALANWATVVLGIVITGLEVGFILAYKAGWQISMLAIVTNAFLAVLLIFLGAFIYKEAITWNKVVGVLICLVGLFFINYNFKK